MMYQRNKGDDGLHTNRHLRIFRKTSCGKEALPHFPCFCRQPGPDLHIYIPETKNFANSTLEVDLDASYLKYPSAAREHAGKILAAPRLRPNHRHRLTT
ncbi:MAG: hypothetical protein ACLFPD_12655 [Desulfosudaceae bacterium]